MVTTDKNKVYSFHLWCRVGILLLFCLFTVLSAGIVAYSNEVYTSGVDEKKIPITIELPYSIAGAEFEINCDDGIKVLSFEASPYTQSSAITPIVEKKGNTRFGFFSDDNIFSPRNGPLFAGTLVLDYDGSPSQYLTILTVKYAHVIDNDTVTTEVFALNMEIDITDSEPEAPGIIDDKNDEKGLQQSTRQYTGLSGPNSKTANTNIVGSVISPTDTSETLPSLLPTVDSTMINPQEGPLESAGINDSPTPLAAPDRSVLILAIIACLIVIFLILINNRKKKHFETS